MQAAQVTGHAGLASETFVHDALGNLTSHTEGGYFLVPGGRTSEAGLTPRRQHRQVTVDGTLHGTESHHRYVLTDS